MGVVRTTVFSLRLALLVALTAVALLGSMFGAAGESAAAPARPTELQFDRYQPVNAARYQSLNYADNGRFFFNQGRWRCHIGRYGSVGCAGIPATAPPQMLGVAIVNDGQGPWWVKPGTTYTLAPQSGYRPKVLGVGQKITANGVTCSVPRKNVMACATSNRAFILSPGWHKFYGNKAARDANPAPRYLPARLR